MWRANKQKAHSPFSPLLQPIPFFLPPLFLEWITGEIPQGSFPIGDPHPFLFSRREGREELVFFSAQLLMIYLLVTLLTAIAVSVCVCVCTHESEPGLQGRHTNLCTQTHIGAPIDFLSLPTEPLELRV